jgi:hypothetical protein
LDFICYGKVSSQHFALLPHLTQTDPTRSSAINP